MSIKNDLFLISELEWLASQEPIIEPSLRLSAGSQSIGVTSQKIHENRLCNIISVMSCV